MSSPHSITVEKTMKTLHLPGSEVCTTANYDENLADKKKTQTFSYFKLECVCFL